MSKSNQIQNWINQSWERFFSRNISNTTRLLLGTFLTLVGFLIAKLLYDSTGTYFTFVAIVTIAVISLFATITQALIFAIVLSLTNDYFLIAPIGSFFGNWPSLEHFFIICSAALFVAALISSLRSAFQQTTLAKRQTEQAKLQKEQALALVSHDIRNPLTAIKMNAELILKFSDQPEKHHQLAVKILSILGRVDSMIQTLLDVSRIRSGHKMPLDLRYCDLNLQISTFIEEMKMIYSERLEFIPTKPCWGNWGVDGLQRALENLVGNAVKYGDANSPIKVTLKKEDDLAVIIVHNEGKTIDVKDQTHLFEEFHRPYTTESGRVRGWGLGLTLVKGVVESHGGSVFVESKDGMGTSFILKLPTKHEPHY